MKDRLRKRERDGHADGPQRRMDGERVFSAMITPRFSFMLEMKKGRTRGQGLRGHAGFRAEGAGKGRTGTPERPHMADRARRTVFRSARLSTPCIVLRTVQASGRMAALAGILVGRGRRREAAVMRSLAGREGAPIGQPS